VSSDAVTYCFGISCLDISHIERYSSQASDYHVLGLRSSFGFNNLTEEGVHLFGQCLILGCFPEDALVWTLVAALGRIAFAVFLAVTHVGV